MNLYYLKRTALIFFCIIIALTKASSQQDTAAVAALPEDEKYFKMLKLRVKTIAGNNNPFIGREYKGSSNFRVMKRYADGTPSKIRFDCVAGSSLTNNPASEKHFFVDVLFKNGLPFATYANDYRIEQAFTTTSYYDSKDDIHKNKNDYFSAADEAKMDQYFKDLKKEQFLNSASYKNVLEKQKAFPAESAIKNNLGILYVLRDNYKFEWVDEIANAAPQLSGSLNKRLDIAYDGKTLAKSLRNISKNTVIIKGIEKKRTKEGYVYRDCSLTLKHNESMPFINIVNEYDYTVELGDYMGNAQYVDDVGLLTSLMNAKTIGANKIEVDSYMNSTNIVVKKGDKIYLRATGTVSLGVLAGKGTPEGIEGFKSYNQVSGINHGALMGKIGSGEWFLVGTAKTIVAARSGVLQLAINDGEPINNSGSFIVDYSINKPIN